MRAASKIFTDTGSAVPARLLRAERVVQSERKDALPSLPKIAVNMGLANSRPVDGGMARHRSFFDSSLRLDPKPVRA